MSLRSLLRKLTPNFLLERYRAGKKQAVNKNLQDQAKSGNAFTKERIVADLKLMGIQNGDTVLVHASMSKIGYLEHGPKTVIDAFLEAVGPEGNILMPTSPNKELQLNHVRNHSKFDARNDASGMGAISETFRKMNGTVRSLNPVEPVSAVGPQAKWLTSGHLGEKSAYTANSPFARLKDLQGKIAYIGVTLDNAGTSLHLLEDAVSDFMFPVYFSQEFEQKIIDQHGGVHHVSVKVHNPEMSKRRKCDELLPWFKENGVYQDFVLGNANVMLFDASKMFDLMLEGYRSKGITMYTPKGV